MHDSKGKYWSIKDSRTAEDGLLAGTQAYMKEKGYQVVSATAPFVAGFADASKPLKSAPAEDGEITEHNPPLFVDGRSPASVESERPGMLAAMTGTFSMAAKNAKIPSNICCSGAARAAIQNLATKAGADAVLFVYGMGTMVPTGKQVAQGVATGLLTTVLTAGIITYAQWDASHLDSYAALVDGHTGEVLWTNSLRMKVGTFLEAQFYQETWPQNVLYHIPSRAPASVAAGK
jgi:hypothetical protein